ncbi:hypothetical protein OC25_17550 [Pedobacter kyungheensis]|uniref:Uncharacterized protein n=1 Tax=Pedobacter kyungheensis TaxID=1069985 RepID=A0A0C1FKB2_9SPHI|nr:hypothetical protein [Pedobacter kyungheensis]KIA92243.1 hypothetical protein OC25_17550 [Pedobacter kyungheensis]
MNNLRTKNEEEMNARLLSWASRMLIMGASMTLVLIIGFQSCKQAASLEGTYVNDAGSEFSIAHDTLIVEHEEGSRYLLHRRTGFQLLDDTGKAGKLQHEKEEWTAVLDKESGILTENRKGKQISFSADGETITVGKRKYKRILTK